MFSSSYVSQFSTLLAKATSEALLSEDIQTNLQVCDMIRGSRVTPQQSVKQIKDRLMNRNQIVQINTLKLLEMCIKNCGKKFNAEVATRPLMDQLMEMVKSPSTGQEVRAKTLDIIQLCGIGFKDYPEMGYACDVYNILRVEGYQFPPVNPATSGITMDSITAPEWSDSDVCTRCRLPFTMIRRKHHCRNCGQTFCATCCSKKMPLPQYGIEEEERVCDGCFSNPGRSGSQSFSPYGAPPSSSSPSSINGVSSYGGGLPYGSSSYGGSPYGGNDSSFGYSSYSNLNNIAPTRQEPLDTFDDDLRKALELSKKETQKQVKPATYSNLPKQDDEEDAELKAAIAASLKEANSTSSSVSSTSSMKTYKSDEKHFSKPQEVKKKSNSNELLESERNSITLFSKFIYKIEQNGDGIAGNTDIQDLYQDVTSLHPKVIRNLEETDEKIHVYQEALEKITRATQMYDKLIEDRMLYMKNRNAPQAQAPVQMQRQMMPPQPNMMPPHQMMPPQQQPQMGPRQMSPGMMPPQPNMMPPQPNMMPPQPNMMPPQPNMMPPQPNMMPPQQQPQPKMMPPQQFGNFDQGSPNVYPNPQNGMPYPNGNMPPLQGHPHPHPQQPQPQFQNAQMGSQRPYHTSYGQAPSPLIEL